MEAPLPILIGQPRRQIARGKPVKKWYQSYRLPSDMVRTIRRCPLHADKQVSIDEAKALTTVHALGHLSESSMRFHTQKHHAGLSDAKTRRY